MCENTLGYDVLCHRDAKVKVPVRGPSNERESERTNGADFWSPFAPQKDKQTEVQTSHSLGRSNEARIAFALCNAELRHRAVNWAPKDK